MRSGRIAPFLARWKEQSPKKPVDIVPLGFRDGRTRLRKDLFGIGLTSESRLKN